MMHAVANTALPRHWPVASDWTEKLQPCFASAQFQKLIKLIDTARSDHCVFPAAENVFNAFRFCSFAQTRVVILGQDPYHGAGQAHGLAFSVKSGEKLPPSLRNIFLELRSDLGIDNGHRGDLSAWAHQGVLLMNTVLTVESGKAYSHRRLGWESFTDQVMEILGQRPEPIVFILWGNQAAAKREWIEPQHVVLQSPHPSPLSAYRGFFGSRPFSRTNDALTGFGVSPINWKNWRDPRRFAVSTR